MSANSFAIIKLFYEYITIILYTLSSRTACLLVSGFSHTVKRNGIDCTLMYIVSKMSQKGNKTTQLFQMTDTALINTLSHAWAMRKKQPSFSKCIQYNCLLHAYQKNRFIRSTKRSYNNYSNEYKAGSALWVSVTAQI